MHMWWLRESRQEEVIALFTLKWHVYAGWFYQLIIVFPSASKFVVTWEETNLPHVTAHWLTALLSVVNSPQHEWHNKQFSKSSFASTNNLFWMNKLPKRVRGCKNLLLETLSCSDVDLLYFQTPARQTLSIIRKDEFLETIMWSPSFLTCIACPIS